MYIVRKRDGGKISFLRKRDGGKISFLRKRDGGKISFLRKRDGPLWINLNSFTDTKEYLDKQDSF